MEARSFVQEMESVKDGRVRALAAEGGESIGGAAPGASERAPAPGIDIRKLLQIALANEVSVSELAAVWMPTTPEMDVKIAFARQAGDEAGHFQLVQGRLEALGFRLEEFHPPGPNALFDYLRALPTSVERVAGGLFTLESIAYDVNENFMRLCEEAGDLETVRIYRDCIQPDERAHQRMGHALLEKYATTPGAQARAREAIERTLEIAAAQRSKAAERLGTRRFPGC